MDNEDIRLTKYSHGAGCGCKISPAILAQILSGNTVMPDNTRLIVGNHSNDDAAVYDLGNGTALISTTDFFMPIVDDPYEFGRIAAANAISDVYAMGGKPILAIAILGWPVNILPASVAQRVIAGARSICSEAGIPLAGGHSIDSPEPIFGLSVNGLIETPFIKRNDAARIGDLLFLTKKIGVGILTTAEKKGVIQPEHSRLAAEQMMQLNSLGEVLGKIPAVHAMTDVTGFGLLGHLCEMADGSGLSSELIFQSVPLLTPHLHQYIDSGCIPGGTLRNWNSYGEKIAFGEDVDIGIAKAVLCDPQTSGGLLVAVSPEGANEVTALLRSNNLCHIQIGVMTEKREFAVLVRNEPG